MNKSEKWLVSRLSSTYPGACRRRMLVENETPIQPKSELDPLTPERRHLFLCRCIFLPCSSTIRMGGEIIVAFLPSPTILSNCTPSILLLFGQTLPPTPLLKSHLPTALMVPCRPLTSPRWAEKSLRL